jgi:hypothetical protein
MNASESVVGSGTALALADAGPPNNALKEVASPRVSELKSMI